MTRSRFATQAIGPPPTGLSFLKCLVSPARGYTPSRWCPGVMQACPCRTNPVAPPRSSVSCLEPVCRSRAPSLSMILKRTGLSLLGLLGVLTVTVLAGVQAGLLTLVGIGFGLALQGYGFGFAGGWRRFIVHGDASGVVSHMLLIALCALATLPLVESNSQELVGALAPISWSL